MGKGSGSEREGGKGRGEGKGDKMTHTKLGSVCNSFLVQKCFGNTTYPSPFAFLKPSGGNDKNDPVSA